MKKDRIVKEDGRYLIYYSFSDSQDSTGDMVGATPIERDKGVSQDVGDAMESHTAALGCDCNSPPGENIQAP